MVDRLEDIAYLLQDWLTIEIELCEGKLAEDGELGSRIDGAGD